MITIDEVYIFRSKQIIEPNGTLTPIEFDDNLPFKPKRIFLVSGVPDKTPRGKHSHYTTKQILCCLNGRIDVKVDDGKKSMIYNISAGESIYIPNLIWDEQVYYTPDTLLMSLCNTFYNTKDYIHDYKEFLSIKNNG